MVARTLVKLFRTTAAKESGKFPGIKPDYQLPALTMDELRHHYAVSVNDFFPKMFTSYREL